MFVYGECKCFVMQMLYVCVLCASCGSSQCSVLHDLQFVNAGRGCNKRPYRRGILQSRSHKTSTDPCTVTTTDIKTNMRHIHTSIVSRHLATRGNNKILRTPPPHISSSEERLPRLTRHTLAQLRTNKSPFLKSYLHKVDAKTHHHHYAPSVTSTHTTHIISSTAPIYAPHCHPRICGQTPPE